MRGNKLVLERYNYDTKTTEQLGEVNIYDLTRAFKSEEAFAEFFAEFLNVGMKDYRTGVQTGMELQDTHRTIQGSAIRFCLGVIIGLSKQDYTDARNETPVAMGKKLARMLEDGELNMGYMI